MKENNKQTSNCTAIDLERDRLDLLLDMAPTQLEIKVRALQRLVKEEAYYQEELKEQIAHVESMKAKQNVDIYDLKKQEEVQQDTEKLLPTLYKKIEQFRDNLEEFLKNYEGTEEVGDAHTAIEVATDLLASR